MFCDLHTHSFYSDGTFSPEEIIRTAKRHLLIPALTDHNTVAGLAEFRAEAKIQGICAVPGVELSTIYLNRELHLLGLFIAPEEDGKVAALTQRFHLLKEESNRNLVHRLADSGYPMDFSRIQSRNHTGQINRAHVAAEMVECGYTTSVSEAFKRFLDPRRGFYEPPEYLAFLEAVSFLRSIHAVPVLAHPLLEMSEEELRKLVPPARDAGLLGIEVYHSAYTASMIKASRKLAAELDLRASGGSDFHGANKPGIEMGVGKGNLAIPESIYQDLLELSIHC